MPIHDDRDNGRPLSVSGRYPARLDDAAALHRAGHRVTQTKQLAA